MERAADRSRGIRVLIVEEQEVIRRGLVAITSTIPEITASAVGVGAIRDQRLLAEFEITVISTTMLLHAERIGPVADQLRPIILVVPTSQPEQLEIATQRHCDGYIMQADLTASSLRATVLRVAAGKLAIPDAIAAYLLDRVGRHDAMLLRQLYHLRPRDAEVLTLLVAGATNKEIASKLRISVHGVKRHVSTLLSQFHSPNRAHLVSHVLRNGMVSSTCAPAT